MKTAEEKAKQIFTVKDFKSHYMTQLNQYKNKDNNGKIQKQKLGIFNGYSYDKMLASIEKILGNNENKLLTDEKLTKIKNAILKYEGKKSNNKLMHSDKVLKYIQKTHEYLKQNIYPLLKNPRFLNNKNLSCLEAIRDNILINNGNNPECTELREIYDKLTEQIESKSMHTSISLGLPNDENYCFLNAAVQQMFGLEKFKNKILAINNKQVHIMEENKTKYKELRALLNIFQHLDYKIHLSDSEIKNFMKDLGYKGQQEDAGEHMSRIMKAVKSQLKQLIDKIIGNMITLTLTNNSDIPKLIDTYCEEMLKNSNSPILVLKSGQFIINLVRKNKSHKLKDIDQTLELKSDLMTIKPSKNSTATIEKAIFNLTGVTIHHGESANSGHYFIYKKVGNNFTCISDNNISYKNWNDIKNDILENATVLVYTLKR